MTTALSLLNLVPLRAGQNSKQAIDAAVRLAQFTESLGYTRYWIAEHHNTPNLASSATQLLIGHVLSQTQSIRIGSGGVMLPNHSPLMVAEQYGTLATLYPQRVDLGLGRAPGTDQRTAAALRRHFSHQPYDFAQDIGELQYYFSPLQSEDSVRAYPAAGIDVPLYILGSSTESAYLAAALGLPYAFAAHFASCRRRIFIAAISKLRRNMPDPISLSRSMPLWRKQRRKPPILPARSSNFS